MSEKTVLHYEPSHAPPGFAAFDVPCAFTSQSDSHRVLEEVPFAFATGGPPRPARVTLRRPPTSAFGEREAVC